MPHTQVISIEATYITCNFIESVAYCIAVVLFVESVLSLLRRRRWRDGINVPLVAVAPLIFFFATLHIVGVWVRTSLPLFSTLKIPRFTGA
ncbi:hypothetical protein AURDEDRAFT_168019 [Auricularia subglabra TFB-10046 SS5]|nr:hypothetical protein AURDEDRAFT_168019 [Auricularia subglabra TFB-10046 SS5]